MDPRVPTDVPSTVKAPPAPTKRPQAAPATSAIAGDAVDAARMSEAVNAARTRPAALSDTQLENLATRKATCPFMAAAVASRGLAVRNSADKPLASIDEVVALGNSGGGNLGEVLKLFATGNHAVMPGASGKFDTPVPPGQFSLDFPGSQGSHPGHSGILQGNPAELDSGRFSQADLDRLFARAKDGHIKRSDMAKFIAENLARDPASKVVGGRVARLLLGDVGSVVAQSGPALLEKLKNTVRGGPDPTDAHRKLVVSLTKSLGEENLVGSAGEFGLLMAFLVNSPRTTKVGGEPAVAVEDLKAMFQDHRFPDGWETWPKTAQDWVTNTTALTVEAGKEYRKLTRPAKHAKR